LKQLNYGMKVFDSPRLLYHAGENLACLLGLVKTGFFRRLIQSLICKFKAFSYSLPARKEYFREVQILYRNNIFCTVARKRKQKFIGIYCIGSNFVT